MYTLVGEKITIITFIFCIIVYVLQNKSLEDIFQFARCFFSFYRGSCNSLNYFVTQVLSKDRLVASRGFARDLLPRDCPPLWAWYFMSTDPFGHPRDGRLGSVDRWENRELGYMLPPWDAFASIILHSLQNIYYYSPFADKETKVQNQFAPNYVTISGRARAFPLFFKLQMHSSF